MAVIGIDLGTTNSVVATVVGDEVQIVTDPQGRRLHPSVISFQQDGVRVFSHDAVARRIVDPRYTVYSAKRLLGQAFRSEEVQAVAARVPYEVREGPNEQAVFAGPNRTFTMPEISGMMLSYLKQISEMYLGTTVEGAVITVPANFNETQRRATVDAGRIAGLDVMRVLNEPTAAALAYGLGRNMSERIAVFDLGGGTFDISNMAVDNGIFEVLSTNGDTALGGDDWDRRLIEQFADEIFDEHRIDVCGVPVALGRLKEAAEQAKCALSTESQATVRVPLPGGKEDYRRTFTRAEFENLVTGLVEKTLAPCRQAIKDAGLSATDVDEVVLVGGSTRMPLVRQRVQALFGKPPHCELNPDEVVALGAAVQADILSGGIQDMLLLDVTPLTLGIEAMGGVVSSLIRRNTTIPTSAKELFTTFVDGQTSVDIHILQGERELAKDNRSLARFQLKIPPLPASVPRVEVTFMIDANGILSVTARDIRTGEAQSIEVKPSHGLSDQEVERMIRDSFVFAQQDITERQRIEAMTEAESILTATEKALARADGLATPEEMTAIRQAVVALTAAMAGADHRPIRNAIAALDKASYSVAEKLMNSTLQDALKDKKLSDVT
jgi:chaperone protein DnaK